MCEEAPIEGGHGVGVGVFGYVELFWLDSFSVVSMQVQINSG